jgi:hypothetical protein
MNRRELLFLEENIAPKAQELDRSFTALKLALQELGDRGMLALTIPQNLGGAGWEELDYRRFQIAIARASGALAFLQTQHQSAVSQLAKSNNQSLQQEYLPHVARGEKLIGVGFSHLRRRGQPIMTAVEVEGGYLLTGKVPWITGWGFFESFIIGAALPDGSEIYGMLPFENSVQTSGGSLTFSDPLELIAMSATNTVTAKLDNWLLDRDRTVALKPLGSIHYNSKKNILHHGFFALGCAYGGLDILQTIGEKKQLDFIQRSWQTLQKQVENCDRTMLSSLSDDNITYLQQLQLRTQAIDLAQRCSQAAIVVSSGAANYLNSAAGRIYREALVFSVSGQTTDVMKASLKLLSNVRY